MTTKVIRVDKRFYDSFSFSKKEVEKSLGMPLGDANASKFFELKPNERVFNLKNKRNKKDLIDLF